MEECFKTAASQETGINPQKAKRRCLFVLLQIGLCGGFLEGFLPEDSFIPLWLVELGMSLSGAIAAMIWCYIDAEQRNFTISFRLSLLLFLLLVVGFPYYILKTRRNLAAFKTLALASLCFVFFIALNWIGYEIGLAVYYRYNI